MVLQEEIYDNFIESYKNYPKELVSVIADQRALLPTNIEDENYNLGTMQKDTDIGLSSNIAVINAHSFEQAFEYYRKNYHDMPDAEIKAKVVFDFLKQHGANFSYEQNKDDFLFKGDNGKDITRENFYANVIYKQALLNTNFFDRNIGNMQILCLEPKSVTATPRNIDGLSKECLDRFMSIPDAEKLEILYKRGLYHESLHVAMGTADERKCDAFALLKIMKEHSEHAKTVFDIYNIQRSKMGFTTTTLHGKQG